MLEEYEGGSDPSNHVTIHNKRGESSSDARELHDQRAAEERRARARYEDTPYGKGIIAAQTVAGLRDGGYLPKAALVKLQRDFSLRESPREYARQLYQDIDRNGENACDR